MTYPEYEDLLRDVLADEINTAKFAGAPREVIEWLRERRDTGNSGRVPRAFKDMRLVSQPSKED